MKFNGEHAANHIAEIGHCLAELDTDLPRRLPEVGREAAALKEAGNLQPSELRPREAGPVGGCRLRCHAAERRA